MSNRDGSFQGPTLTMKPFGVEKVGTPADAQSHAQQEDLLYGGPRPRAQVGRPKVPYILTPVRAATLGLKLGPIDQTWIGRVPLDPRVVVRVSMVGTLEAGPGAGDNNLSLWSSIMEAAPDGARSVENVIGTRAAPLPFLVDSPALTTPDLEFFSFEVQQSGSALEFRFRFVMDAASSIFINGTAWYFVVRYSPVEELTDAEWEVIKSTLNWMQKPVENAF